MIFPLATPEYFAEFAAQARYLGARVIGGCCGTTPTEIAAIRAAIDEGREASATRSECSSTPRRRRSREEAPDAARPAARDGEFVVSVQLDPPLGGNAAALLDVGARAQGVGLAQIVDVNDNPTRPGQDERPDRVGGDPAARRDRDGART